MVVHGLAQDDIGVGVKALCQLVAVMLEIGLHCITTALERIFLGLRAAPEPELEFRAGPIADLAETTGDGQAIYRSGARPVIVATRKGRILAYGADLQGAQCDLISCCRRSDGQHDGTTDPLGIADTPFEHAHSAHGSPDDTRPRRNAERIGQAHFDAHLITNGDHGEFRAVVPPVRATRRRSGRPLAAAENVRAHHEVAVRVERCPWPDEAFPPTRRHMAWSRRSGRMRVSREGMEHQDAVAPLRVWRPPRFISDRDLREHTAALQRDTTVGLAGKLHELPPTRITAGQPDAGKGLLRHAPLAARNPASRSARISSIDSRPTDNLIRSGVTPVVVCSASVNWEWVVDAG